MLADLPADLLADCLADWSYRRLECVGIGGLRQNASIEGWNAADCLARLAYAGLRQNASIEGWNAIFRGLWSDCGVAQRVGWANG